MPIVLDSLTALALILGAIWLWSLLQSAARDRREAQAQATQQAERERLLAREARLTTQGLPLACLSCGTRFAGPLPATGCPKCRVGAFVVPEEEASHVHH